MMSEVREALEGCDLLLLIVDVTRKFGRDDESVLEMARKSKTPVFLLLNKIDLLRNQKDKLLPIIDGYRSCTPSKKSFHSRHASPRDWTFCWTR